MTFMKINKNFILRTVAEEYLVIPVGKAALRVAGLIRLSESGGYLFCLLEKGYREEDLLQELGRRYEVPEDTDLKGDVCRFLAQMNTLGMLEEASGNPASQTASDAKPKVKAAYVQPQVFYENYELSQHVAACDWDVYYDDYKKCTVNYDPLYENTKDYGTGFNGEKPGCEWLLEVSDGNTKVFCYTVAAEGSTLFRS